MPAWLALCDLGARGWGSPGFRTVLCCFLSHLLYGDFVCDVSLLHMFLLSPYQSLYNSKSLSFATVLYCSMSLCKFFGVLVAVLFVFGFCFFCSFCFACLVGFSASFCIVAAYWTVYRSSFSTTFAAHHSKRWNNYNA